MLACYPSWIRVPIFTFLYFCCYGSRCVGETADVFTGSFPRQWCAWGVCAGGGKFFMHQLCCQYRCWKFPWWQCVGLRLKLSGSVGQDLGCLSSCWYSPLSDALYSSTLKMGSLCICMSIHSSSLRCNLYMVKYTYLECTVYVLSVHIPLTVSSWSRENIYNTKMTLYVCS